MSIITGGVVIAGGVVLAILLVLGAQFQDGETGIGDTALPQAIAVGVLGVCLGLILIAEGIRERRGVPSAPFRPRRAIWLWLAFAVLLVAGTIASLLDTPPLLMALFHAPTLLLLPVLVLTLVGWGLGGRGVSWSDVSGGLLGGAILGTGTALVIEAVLMIFLVIGLFALGLLPQEWLQQAPQALVTGEPPFPIDEMEDLLEQLPPSLILVALVFIGGLVPLVEEVTKTLGVGLAGFWLRPSPARAFLLGVASGAGFALAENMLNSVFLGPAWGPGVLARLVATIMHCATGGLMGWGWGQWWARRPLRLPLAFAGAATVHSLWNSCAAGLVLIGLSVLTRAGDPIRMGLAGLLMATLLGLFALLACGVAAALLWASHRLGRSAP
ncbi:MAG: PrsW family intramembrane metalloprotease [Anaerolineae bacterium]|nr:PrsW family intramembrane metalloprotease [Anaerolineae bacterium]